MNRLLKLALGLGLFCGACAAPGNETQPTAAAPQPTPPPANPTPAPAPVRTNSADAFNGVSGIVRSDPTPAPAPANPGAPANQRPTNGNGNGAAVRPAGNTVEGPQVPAGANFTLFCKAFTGPDHVMAATQMRQLLMTHSRLQGWYVIHQDTQSALYHGYYRQSDQTLPPDASQADKSDAERIKQDKAMIETIPDPSHPDRKLFGNAMIVPLDSPDPDAPPQWNLANAQGYWSVQIAAFTGPDRKSLAVESVKAARAMGVPAFYFHAENGVSSVCVGTWPEEAVRLPAFMADPSQTAADANRNDQAPVLYNLTGQPLDPNSIAQLSQKTGQQIQVNQGQAEIVDKTLEQTLKDYPVHAVNGYDQGSETGEPRPSFIVQLPGRHPSGRVPTAGGGAPVTADGTGTAAPGGTGAPAINPALQRRLQGIGR